MAVLVLFAFLSVSLAIGVPVFASLGIAGVLSLVDKGMDLLVVPQTIFDTLDSFTLMAIPFFILAGTLMQTGGISARLIRLANVLVGWLRGGLGASSILTCMFFATMSGSSSATTAAIGTSMIPAMEDKGYPRNFAAACVAVGGELGAVIPPSLVMIIYGLVGNISIGALFIAGILPGMLVGISLMLLIIVAATVLNFDVTTKISFKGWCHEIIPALRDSWLALLMPVIILGGIYSGVFTATEAAAVAVLYALFVGKIIYKELTTDHIIKALYETVIMTGVILLIVAFASIFAYVLTINQVPHKFGSFIASTVTGPITFLIFANVLLLISGMFMEAAGLIIILVPILSPIATMFGIDPIHFGIVVILNLCIGMVTPPVGINLFIACQIADLPLEKLIRPLVLFLAVLVVDLMIISYIPGISLAFL